LKEKYFVVGGSGGGGDFAKKEHSSEVGRGDEKKHLGPLSGEEMVRYPT